MVLQVAPAQLCRGVERAIGTSVLDLINDGLVGEGMRVGLVQHLARYDYAIPEGNTLYGHVAYMKMLNSLWVGGVCRDVTGKHLHCEDCGKGDW